MANKIITLGLQKTIEDLISSAVTTSTAISAALKEKGYNVSQPTVSRYLQEVKEARKEATKDILDAHLREKLPADLDALETMEAKCLAWAGENNTEFAHRLAEKHIEESASDWITMIMQLSDADIIKKRLAVRQIIIKCMSWTADDIKLQTARIAAMRQAASIIEMKLRYTLGNSEDGKIIFMDSERGDKLNKDEETGRYMVIPGGKD